MGSLVFIICKLLMQAPRPKIGIYQDPKLYESEPIDCSRRPPFLPSRFWISYHLPLLTFCRHARIGPCKQHSRGVVHRHDPLVHVRLTVRNTLLQDLTEPGWPSSIYGVTSLQVYSYYNSHCSRDRWPLKSFVSVPHWSMLGILTKLL